MEISHYDNLPTRYRMQHGIFDFNRDETQMQLRYRTAFDICVEMDYLSDGLQYYHDRFAICRKAALQFLDVKTLQIDKELGRAIEPMSDDEVRLADRYNEILKRLSKRDCELLALVSEHIPSGTNIPQLRIRLHQLRHPVSNAFNELKKVVDSF